MAAEALAAAPRAAAAICRGFFSQEVCHAPRVSPAAAEERAEPLAGRASEVILSSRWRALPGSGRPRGHRGAAREGGDSPGRPRDVTREGSGSPGGFSDADREGSDSPGGFSHAAREGNDSPGRT